VSQFDLYLTRANSWGSATIGGWGNVELKLAKPGATEQIGLGRRVSEGNAWAELAAHTGPVTLTGGVTRYFYDSQAAALVRSAVVNTTDLHASVQVQDHGWAAKITGWHDVDRVHGSYLEGTATYRMPFVPVVLESLMVGATAGRNYGQSLVGSPPSPNPYFARGGWTHIDLFSALQAVAGPLYFSITVHLQANRDPMTRRVSGDISGASRDTMVWGGLGASWQL
jgi:hypothetical protein